jgi:hypothetical protein
MIKLLFFVYGTTVKPLFFLRKIFCFLSRVQKKTQRCKLNLKGTTEKLTGPVTCVQPVINTVGDP